MDWILYAVTEYDNIKILEALDSRLRGNDGEKAGMMMREDGNDGERVGITMRSQLKIITLTADC